jgi:hypothetical protein
MLEAVNRSEPKSLKPREWHIPYGDSIEYLKDDQFIDLVKQRGIQEDFHRYDSGMIHMKKEVAHEFMLKIATARCAQVSYTVVGEDGKAMDYAKLVALHDRLAASGHWSPFEHCAYSMSESDEARHVAGKGRQQGWVGNFRGWFQYRKLFDNENRTDPRFIKKTYNG